MKPNITVIHQRCAALADGATALGQGNPAVAPTLAPPLAKLRTDTALLAKAWSDMAVRNLLADLLRSVLALQRVLQLPAAAAAVAATQTVESRGPSQPAPLVGRARSNAVSGDNSGLGACKSICAGLLPLLEAELAEHSPTKAKYTYVACLGYKVKVAGANYSGLLDDAADMKARCEEMKTAIRAAYALSDRDARSYNNHTSLLKVFVAPEFYFRGRNGAYDHAVVHGGEQRTDADGAVVKQKHQGIAEIMREELDKPQYKDWLFVLGTAIAATRFTETVCTVCNGKIVFDLNATHGNTTPRCSANPVHRIAERVNGAYVENVGLIFKNGEFHTVTKELVSHIDYKDGDVKGKVRLGSTVHDVVTDKRASGYNAATSVPTKFTDERMGGCIFTIDGITIGVEVCLDHAATSGSKTSGRLSHAGNIQLQIVPSAGMSIKSLSTVQGGVVFNVDGATPHVEVVGGAANAVRMQSTRYEGFTFTSKDHAAASFGGSDLKKLEQVQKAGRGGWLKHGAKPVSAAAGRGAVVLYGPFGLPRA